jgi:uncharacterized protein YdcH (DUF465 family)
MEKKFFLQNYIEFLIKLLVGFGLLYLFLLVITPKTKLSDEDRKKIENLDEKIDKLIKQQNKIDSTITGIELNIDSINNDIIKIKKQKVLIREIYHEEINRVAQYNDAAIDSFFTERYGYYPRKNISDTNSKINN